MSVIDSTSRSSAIIFRNYRRAGSELHLHCQKIAAVISYRGEGTIQAQEDLEDSIVQHGGIPFECMGFPHVMPVADRYQHTGSWSREDGTCSTDIVCKCCAMRESAKSLRKHYMNNSNVSSEAKVTAVKLYILPRGEYGSSGCHPTNREVARYQRTVYDMYRLAANMPRKPKNENSNPMTDIVVASQIGMLVLMFRLAFARIGTLSQVLRKSKGLESVFLHAGFRTRCHWLARVWADLQYLAMQSSLFEHMQGAEFHQWVPMLRSGWDKLKSKMIQAYLAMGTDLAANTDVNITTSRSSPAHYCEMCTQVFGTRSALRTHEYQAHGIQRGLRRKVVGSQCPICVRQYQNRTKLMWHLYGASETCRINIFLFFPNLPNEIIEQANQAQAKFESEKRQKGESTNSGRGPSSGAWAHWLAPGSPRGTAGDRSTPCGSDSYDVHAHR